MAKMTIERIGLDEANAFVSAHHRHHKPVVGWIITRKPMAAQILADALGESENKEGKC